MLCWGGWCSVVETQLSCLAVDFLPAAMASHTFDMSTPLLGLFIRPLMWSPPSWVLAWYWHKSRFDGVINCNKCCASVHGIC